MCGTPGGSLSHGSGALDAVDDLLAEAALVEVLEVPEVDDFEEVCALAATANAASVRIKATCFMIG
jgi:hypothetical protein